MAQNKRFSGSALGLNDSIQWSGQTAVTTRSAIRSASAFRDVSGVVKLPPVYSRTPSTVIVSRICLHLFR
jgi:hypothetical protein